MANEDVMTIHMQGLEEGIRCAMCTNSMRSNRGCDGSCVVNECMYREVMNTIENHIVSPVTSTQEPCEDAVSRKDIYFKLTNGAYPNETIEQFIDRLIKELEVTPSVTLQPKVAQWVSKGDVYPAWRYCSKCGEPWSFNCGTPNFCPVCGAKMEKEE